MDDNINREKEQIDELNKIKPTNNKKKRRSNNRKKSK